MKTIGVIRIILFLIILNPDLYSGDGQLDLSFGQGGIVNASFNVSGRSIINSSVIQKDGKIVVGGYSQIADKNVFTVGRYNSGGNLDYTFGTNGIVVTPIGDINDMAQSVAIQSDGMIILAGYSTGENNDNFALVRYFPDGTLDTNFGEKGISVTKIGTGPSHINSVKIQKDGKIIAVGFALRGDDFDAVLARYNTNGELDYSFATNGIAITPIGNSNDNLQTVEIQTDGKIVAAGYSLNGGNYNMAVLRYNSNGDLDKSFGKGGVSVATTGNLGVVQSIAISEGKIIAAGYSYIGSKEVFTLIRYKPDGNPDSTFGTHGIVTTPIGTLAYANSINIQTNGQIVVAGPASNGLDYDFAAVRYNKNGDLDKTFGKNGITIIPVGIADDIPNSSKIQQDGKIILSGCSGVKFNERFTLIRLNVDGNLDHTFANSGINETQLGASNNFALSTVIQNDGKILAGGYSKNLNEGNDFDFAVCRFNENGTTDNSFGSKGISLTRIASSDEYGRSIALQTDGKIIIAGNSVSDKRSRFSVIRYNSNGVIDNDFGNNGLVNTAIGNIADVATSVAIQKDGKIVVAGYSLNAGNFKNLAIVRYTSAGGLDNTFGINGIITLPVTAGNDNINSISIQIDGKIIISGYSTIENSSFNFLIRLNSEGTLDGTFGNNGIVAALKSFIDVANSIALEGDGSVIAAGSSFNGTDNDFSLIRYKSNGKVDSTFGINGIVKTAIRSEDDQVNSLAIQTDGKILAGGTSCRGPASDFVVARYNADGTTDNSFGNNGSIITPMGNSISEINSITIQTDGNILAVGNSWDGNNYSVFSLLRYICDRKTGIHAENTNRQSETIFLEQNFPNPFTENTIIKYNLITDEFVTLKIYNLMGQEIRTLFSGNQNQGQYEFVFSANGLPAGTYFYRLSSGNNYQTRIMIHSK